MLHPFNTLKSSLLRAWPSGTTSVGRTTIPLRTTPMGWIAVPLELCRGSTRSK